MLCPVICITNNKYLPLCVGMDSRKANQLLSATRRKPCTLPAALIKIPLNEYVYKLLLVGSCQRLRLVVTISISDTSSAQAAGPTKIRSQYQSCSVCVIRESNPGLYRGRVLFYH